MNDFAKLDVSLELIATEIAKTVMLYEETKEDIYLERLKVLKEDKNKIYAGDIKTINKILSNKKEGEK